MTILNMWHSVDFRKLVIELSLVGLRKYGFVSLLNALITPLDNLHYKWKTYRSDNLYKLEHTGQVCYLRGALNDRFDPSERRITIDGTGGNSEPTYIYTPGENQTKYLGKLFLRNSLEFADTGADFTVRVPREIMNQSSYEVRALIDFYRLGGMRYLIIEI
ncbi:hypothetical protein LLW17_01310 [Leeuwenhoekiella sp. Mr9]|uniref:Uncharacterized protein n=2 Tax=Leeuwenhoekiella parthenopeia TaxID=2890320 RepID=A0ABS8GPY3_9FLAO|nr:hypothetical protein [Leeuwenhoekiella parthenopeia]